jgi:thiamine biosynthesis lipoprotein
VKAQSDQDGTISPHASARWRALGSTALVRVTEPCELELAVACVKRTFDEFDQACSRFREDSELSLVNARAGRLVATSQLLLDAVEIALRGAELTGGLLDPCLGRVLEDAGYDRDWELIRDRPRQANAAPERLIARRRDAWRAIELDRASRSVRIPAHSKLDLGATAKALAVDRACAAVHSRFGHGVLVALGGDLAARGRAPAGGWQIHVTDDHRSGPDAPGQRIAIDSGGLATSSTVTRRWRVAGETRHHIIDPSTGRPAVTRWRTASVAAADCSDANIASTTAVLRDGDAPGWLAELGLPARLVEVDGTVHMVAGWPEAERPSAPVVAR